MHKIFLRFFTLFLAPLFFAQMVHADPMDRAVLARMDTQINAAIGEKKLPGAVIWVEHDGDVYHKAFGDRARATPIRRDDTRHHFDAASLTKVVAGVPGDHDVGRARMQ